MILIPILGIVLLIPFVFYILAEHDIFFTKLETGDIKFVVRGESLVKILHDVKGRKLTDGPHGQKVFSDAAEEHKTFLNRTFGLWWIGFPPFAKVHSFKIVPEREDPNATNKNDWVKTEKERDEKSLRFVFPRPYFMKEVELNDTLSVDLLVIAKFEVVVPHIPVFMFKGKFFDMAGSVIRAHVADIINNMDLATFITSNKGEVKGILSEMKEDGNFNKELIRLVGLKLVGIAITQFDPSDNEIRNAMRAKELAVKKGEASIAEAEAEMKANELRARAIERTALARGAQIKETVTALASSAGNADVVAMQAGKVLQAEALTGKDSKITTWVDGGTGVQPVVPIAGGDKK